MALDICRSLFLYIIYVTTESWHLYSRMDHALKYCENKTLANKRWFTVFHIENGYKYKTKLSLCFYNVWFADDTKLTYVNKVEHFESRLFDICIIILYITRVLVVCLSSSFSSALSAILLMSLRRRWSLRRLPGGQQQTHEL